eukprot:m.31129 g.31129  ORF g.31129 m.31129 type:complete len:586 (+) comp8280_c3_seq1:251-2008(+)
MFISPGNFDVAYNRIKTSALKGNNTVQVFVAQDVDSLCAAKILTELLKSDFISYSVVPTADMNDLMNARDALIQSPGDVLSAVLINAGGTIDILEQFQALEEQPLEHIQFYLIDCHRPLHLSNVYDEERVFVFDDGQTQENIPAMEDVWNLSDSENEDDLDDPEGSSKRRRTEGRLSPRSKREQQINRDLRQQEYYRSTSFGVGASVLMWQLASDIGKGENKLLWLAIVGLTDQFVHERIDSQAYASGVERLADDVKRINTMAEEGDGDKSDRITIKQEDELRLMLLRQWTVLEAMQHSRYIATRLGIWRQIGKQRLRNLLAKIGISLEQCKQKYMSMDFKQRSRLFDQMSKFAPDYKLDHCIFPSFVSQASFRLQYSASDVVYAITGLLESSPEKENEPIDWRSNFYNAFDALSMKNQTLVKKGINFSMKQHAAILRQVESIIEGKSGVRKAKEFRWVIIKDQPDQKYFVYPAALQKLGHFLLDSFKFNASDRRRSRALPLLLCALNAATETYTVVGLWSHASREEGHVAPNEFGRHFDTVAERIQARAKLTSFDSSVMELKSDDLQKFLTSLQQHFQAEYALE